MLQKSPVPCPFSQSSKIRKSHKKPQNLSHSPSLSKSTKSPSTSVILARKIRTKPLDIPFPSRYNGINELLMSGHSGSEGKNKHHFRSNQSKIMLFYTILTPKCLWYFVEKGMIVKHFHGYSLHKKSGSESRKLAKLPQKVPFLLLKIKSS